MRHLTTVCGVALLLIGFVAPPQMGERFTLSPVVNSDVVDGSATWAYGLSIDYLF